MAKLEIEVSTGFIGDTSTEITSGLNENQTVVLNSYATSGFGYKHKL